MSKSNMWKRHCNKKNQKSENKENWNNKKE